MDPAQIEANINLEKAMRRANLLAAAAQVSQNLTHILDIDDLLPKTVDIICDTYGFYYAGVFLIDPAGEFAVLRAGRGEPGRIMIENHHKLAVGGNSMIGACTAYNQARISLDVDTEKVWYPNPVLPDTRSEMALPLAVGQRVIGAVTVQSVEPAAFTDEDITSLQAMANQLAIALDNAHQRRELEETHAELVRAKTFEAIATATGDAIHWIGNKAEPISPSAARVRYDMQLLICAIAQLLPDSQVNAVSALPAGAGDLKIGQATPTPISATPLTQLLLKEAETIRQNNPDLAAEADRLNNLPLEKLSRRLSLDSMLEDLDIISQAASLIMRVKEDLIGPAREQAPRPTMVQDILPDVWHSLDLPGAQVNLESQSNLPLVLADPIQLHRVFTNLLKNAYESVGEPTQVQIKVKLYLDDAGKFVQVEVSDNGLGIPADELDKIWITFHTTKGVKGHAGLGLSACRLILEQMGGHIEVSSQPGQGATFTVSLPVYRPKETRLKLVPGRGKILLIDDNDSWQHFAAVTLKAAGYKISLSGQDYTVDSYGQYDLILVDDILTGGDSLTILQAIQSAGVIGRTVVVSSNPRVERTKVRMLLGLQNLLPKFYTPAELLSEVKKALNAAR